MPPKPHPGTETSERLTKNFIDEARQTSILIDSFLTSRAETIDGNVSKVAYQRMRRVTGESELPKQLQILKDLYHSLSLVDQSRALLYVSGYPPQSLIALGGEDIRETIAQLEAFGSRRVYEARRQQTQKAMATQVVRTSAYRSIEDDPGLAERWDLRAACKGMPIEMFFPEKGQASTEAIKVCATCEVKEACLKEELRSSQQFGVRGGMSENERRLLIRRARRAARGKM